MKLLYFVYFLSSKYFYKNFYIFKLKKDLLYKLLALIGFIMTEQKIDQQETPSGTVPEKQEHKINHKIKFKRRVLEVRGLEISYNNPEVLQRFITKTGKIIPRRLTGASAKLQRKISKEIKRARMANLLPYTKR